MEINQQYLQGRVKVKHQEAKYRLKAQVKREYLLRPIMQEVQEHKDRDLRVQVREYHKDKDLKVQAREYHRDRDLMD